MIGSKPMSRSGVRSISRSTRKPPMSDQPHQFAHPAPLPPMPATEPTPPTPSRRVGFVALVGKPNVGKSTLLNTLLGQKVAIVSPRPQTTRVPLRGILTRDDAQIIFIDTPGIHTPDHELGQFMVALAQRTIPEADVVCFMVDVTIAPTRLDVEIAERVLQARVPRLLVINKVDLPPRPGQAHDANMQHVQAYRDLGSWDMELAISALHGDGVPELLEQIVARLPYGEPLYPDDWIVDQSVQNLAAEIVREKILLFTQHEIPHSVAVEIDEWNERATGTYIRMTINVERDSQKGIIIGAQGAMLKRIGTAARKDIEELVERAVFLDLWVKTRPNWRNDQAALGWLGYRLKDWG